MKQMSNAVSFKSYPDFWAKEMDGRKSNTVRVMKSEDWEWLLSEQPAEIFMVNTATKRMFIRKISDMMKVRELDAGLCEVLISWRHPRCEFVQ